MEVARKKAPAVNQKGSSALGERAARELRESVSVLRESCESVRESEREGVQVRKSRMNVLDHMCKCLRVYACMCVSVNVRVCEWVGVIVCH